MNIVDMKMNIFDMNSKITVMAFAMALAQHIAASKVLIPPKTGVIKGEAEWHSHDIPQKLAHRKRSRMALWENIPSGTVIRIHRKDPPTTQLVLSPSAIPDFKLRTLDSTIFKTPFFACPS